MEYVYTTTSVKKETEKRNPFLVPASFTVEVACVMCLFLWGLVIVISFVYRLHGRVIAEYITHYSGIRAAHMEKIYEKDGFDMERINRVANEHMKKIGILNESMVEIKRGMFQSTSSTMIFDEEFRIRKGINDPENFMRMITIVEGVKKVGEEKD